MAKDGHHQPIEDVRERLRQVEAEIVAQNETISALERAGRDARAARAERAQLWVRQESYLAEVEQLLEGPLSSSPGRDGPK